MNKKIILTVLLLLLLNSLLLCAADLVINEKASQFIDDIVYKTSNNRSVDLNSASLQGTDDLMNVPVAYEVVKAVKSKKVLTTLTNMMTRNSDLRATVKFNEKTGSYFYIDNEAAPLSIKDETLLKSKADTVLKEMTGADSHLFIFANTEEDYILTSNNDTQMLAFKSYRYIRKLNGRFVADNTAFVKITLGADNKVIRFTLTNPVLKPVMMKQLINTNATKARLQKFAVEKETVRAPDGTDVGVKTITAQKGTNTYYAEARGTKTLLIPYVSFWSSYQLENEDSFERYINLSLDASTTSNLDNSMIDTIRN